MSQPPRGAKSLTELLEILESGQSLLMWIASWRTATGDDALLAAWRAERSPVALRQVLGLVAADGPLETTGRRLDAAGIRALVPEPPSLAQLVRIARKITQIEMASLRPDAFVRWGWWTATVERAGDADPVRWVWQRSEAPRTLAMILDWVAWQEAYGQAVGLTLVDADVPYETWRRETCAAIRGLVDRAPTMADLPPEDDPREDPTLPQLAAYLRKLVASVSGTG